MADMDNGKSDANTAKGSPPAGEAPSPPSADSDSGRLLPSAREVWRNLSALVLWSLALVGVLLAQMRWWELRMVSGRFVDGFPPAATDIAPVAQPWQDWALYVPLVAMAGFCILFMAVMGRWIPEPLVRGRVRFWGTALTVLAGIFSVMMTLMYQMGSHRAF